LNSQFWLRVLFFRDPQQPARQESTQIISFTLIPGDGDFDLALYQFFVRIESGCGIFRHCTKAAHRARIFADNLAGFWRCCCHWR